MPDKTTGGRDYQLDEFVYADTAERLKALGDDFRLHVCDLVLERAMSVTELAEATDRPKGTVAYHVDLLVDAGLLKVVRTRKVRALEERFYGRVGRTIVFPEAFKDQAGLPFLDGPLADFDTGLRNQLEPPGQLPPVGGARQPGNAGRPGISTYRRARIPLERASEYAQRLYELTAEFVDEPRDGDIEFGLYVLLFPTVHSPRNHSPREQSAPKPDQTQPDQTEEAGPADD